MCRDLHIRTSLHILHLCLLPLWFLILIQSSSQGMAERRVGESEDKESSDSEEVSMKKGGGKKRGNYEGGRGDTI